VRKVLKINRKWNHQAARTVHRKSDSEEWKTAFKFGFTRNPFDRLVSWYAYHRSPSHVPKGVTVYQDNTFSEWVKKGCPHHFTPGIMDPGGSDRELNPLFLCDFLENACGQVIVDYLARYEHFEDSLKFICRQLEVPYEKPPKMNASRRSHYRDYYTPGLVKVVRGMFARDLDRFGYVY
jgi:hypothetical protein